MRVRVICGLTGIYADLGIATLHLDFAGLVKRGGRLNQPAPFAHSLFRIRSIGPLLDQWIEVVGV